MKRMIMIAMPGLVLVLSFTLGGLYAREEGGGMVQVKTTKKIIICKDKAIVDGDTIDLEDLKEDIRRIGDLDITIVGGLEDLEGDGITKKRNEVVKFGGNVRVERDEKIMGSVVVFGGNAFIAGAVTEDVVVLGGDLFIEETADIRGSAVCLGGDIEKTPGAKIGEQEVSLGKFPFGIAIGPFIGHDDYGVGRFMHRGVGFFAKILCLGLMLLLGAGTVFFFPNTLDRVEGMISGYLIKSGLVGLLGEILVLPVFLIVSIILCVSIIGIPLLFLVIPLGILGLVAACFLGYIGAGMFAGRKIGDRAKIPMDSPYKVMILGIIALLAFNILAAIVGFAGVLWPVKIIFAIAGGIITYLAATVGFGAVILTRIGTKPVDVKQNVEVTTGGR